MQQAYTHIYIFSPLLRSNLHNILSLFILSSLFMFCGHSTLSLCLPLPLSRGICFHFQAFLPVTYYCMLSNKRGMLQKNPNNDRKMKPKWERKRSRRQVFQIVLSSGFGTLYWCGLYLSNKREAESWIIEALRVIKVKLKQHTHPHKPHSSWHTRVHHLLYVWGLDVTLWLCCFQK